MEGWIDVNTNRRVSRMISVTYEYILYNKKSLHEMFRRMIFISPMSFSFIGI